MDNIDEKLNKAANIIEKNINIEFIINKGIRYLDELEDNCYIKNAKQFADIFIKDYFYNNFIEAVTRNICYKEYDIEKDKGKQIKITIEGSVKLIDLPYTGGDLDFYTDKSRDFITNYLIKYIDLKLVTTNKLDEIKEAITKLGGELTSYYINIPSEYGDRYSSYFNYKITLKEGKLFNKVRQVYMHRSEE